MLDKMSEIILNYAINQYNISDNYINFDSYDAKLLNIPLENIVMICDNLASEGYFTDFITYYDEGCRVRVTGKALAYSEHKRAGDDLHKERGDHQQSHK